MQSNMHNEHILLVAIWWAIIFLQLKLNICAPLECVCVFFAFVPIVHMHMYYNRLVTFVWAHCQREMLKCCMLNALFHFCCLCLRKAINFQVCTLDYHFIKIKAQLWFSFADGYILPYSNANNIYSFFLIHIMHLFISIFKN